MCIEPNFEHVFGIADHCLLASAELATFGMPNEGAGRLGRSLLPLNASAWPFCTWYYG